jgi:hypothetical protein
MRMMRTSDLPSSAESQNVGLSWSIGSSGSVDTSSPRLSTLSAWKSGQSKHSPQVSINSFSVDSLRTVAAIKALDDG